MPNLVLEKNGQTYRFGLNTDRSVTNGKAVPVTYNGVNYYARYGTDATPLKIELNGRTYSIQYDAVEFTRYYWERSASDHNSYSTTLFFPKGQYRVTLDGREVNSWNINVNDSGNRTVSISFRGNEHASRYICSISGLFDERVVGGYRSNKLIIERIGD